jgi:arginine repressor
MTHNKEQDIQGTIENLLRNNQFKSYSKEEIINLISADTSTQEKIEKILGEMEVWSSMKDTQSSVYSSCKGGTVYFQWVQTP